MEELGDVHFLHLSFPLLLRYWPLWDLLSGAGAPGWSSAWFQPENLSASLSFNSCCIHVVESSNKSLGPVCSWVLGFHSSCSRESSSRLCWRLMFSFKLSSMIFFWKYWILFSDVFKMCFASVSWISEILMSLQVTLYPLVKVSHSQPMKWRSRGLIFLSFLQEAFHVNVFRFLFSTTKHRVCNWGGLAQQLVSRGFLCRFVLSIQSSFGHFHGLHSSQSTFCPALFFFLKCVSSLL